MLIQAVHPVLMARDVSSSIAFFGRLGFKPLFMDSQDSPRYAAIAREGCELHLQWQDSSQWEGDRDRPTYRFLVTDVEALFREFQNAGILSGSPGPLASPENTSWGTREFHLRDPSDNGLQFYSPC